MIDTGSNTPSHNLYALIQRHKEYNKENGSKVGFCKFLRILQYSNADINIILNDNYYSR